MELFKQGAPENVGAAPTIAPIYLYVEIWSVVIERINTYRYFMLRKDFSLLPPGHVLVPSFPRFGAFSINVSPVYSRMIRVDNHIIRPYAKSLFAALAINVNV